MSRREPRVSTGARQNDALFEYEALKKKFLHANKAITKLNSTLSIRIEELNAELSALYVENLRLRTSELALAAQLRRERERSRKLLVDTETAALNLTKQLESLRQSYNIDVSPPTPPTPPSPKARRPPPTINTDIQVGRLSRPPNIPEIHEEEEPVVSSSDSDAGKPTSFRSRATSKQRSPTSRSLRQACPTSPPLHLDFNTAIQRKKRSRRQSSLLSPNINEDTFAVPRPSSPAYGSPIRKAAALAQEEEEAAAILDEFKTKHDVKADHRKRKVRLVDKGLAEDARVIPTSIDVRSSRERKRPRDEDEANHDINESKHVSRLALQPIDNTVQEQADIDNGCGKAVIISTRSGIPQTTPSSSSPVDIEPRVSSLTSRERRARKSVNYAEPKLNTKMRKPDPPSGSENSSRKKRSSAAAVMTSTTYKSRDGDMERDDDDNDITSKQPPDTDNGRPHPMDDNRVQTMPSSSMAVASSKKHRSRLPSDDEDVSDGAEADEEYIPQGRSNWINLDGRKRNIMSKRTITTTFSPVMDAGTDTRRHSMVV